MTQTDTETEAHAHAAGKGADTDANTDIEADTDTDSETQAKTQVLKPLAPYRQEEVQHPPGSQTGTAATGGRVDHRHTSPAGVQLIVRATVKVTK